jgi:hypothetical protein
VSLDVRVVAPSIDRSAKKAYRRHVAALEWDGYYEYLRRFWPASSSSGDRIDLYDDAHFEGANLAQLRDCLLQARSGLHGRPSEWEERIGSMLDGTAKRLRHIDAHVNRGTLDALIGRLLEGVEEAERRKGRLAFNGD